MATKGGKTCPGVAALWKSGEAHSVTSEQELSTIIIEACDITPA